MIKFGKFHFTIIPKEPLILPSYKGSTLRGGFGHAFRRVVCALKKADCSDCMLKEKCVYSYVFETPPPSETKMMRKYKAAPHPFVIEPPPERRIGYMPGEEIIFGLILIGRAMDYLPYFVYAFHELGGIGIGNGKAKFDLKEVGSGGKIIYDSSGKHLKPFTPSEIMIEFPVYKETIGKQRLTLIFLTPARIVYNNQFVSNPDFHIIIRQLLRRLSLLYYFHCGGDPSAWDFKGTIEKAQAIKTAASSLKWHDWERYSARQDTRMKMGGFVGEVVFEGDIDPFLSLIKAGEILHVGKGTSFGLGRYEIKDLR